MPRIDGIDYEVGEEVWIDGSKAEITYENPWSGEYEVEYNPGQTFGNYKETLWEEDLWKLLIQIKLSTLKKK